MKTLLWKLRFAWHLSRTLGWPFRLGWKGAREWLRAYPETLDYSPIEAAEEEIDCWRRSQ